MSDDIPQQFDAPFRIGPDGQVVTVDQGSAADIGACIYNVVTCPQGAALNQPEFGIPSPLFQSLPLDLNVIVKAVQKLEPRATIEAIQHTLARATSTVDVTLTATVIAPG